MAYSRKEFKNCPELNSFIGPYLAHYPTTADNTGRPADGNSCDINELPVYVTLDSTGAEPQGFECVLSPNAVALMARIGEAEAALARCRGAAEKLIGTNEVHVPCRETLDKWSQPLRCSKDWSVTHETDSSITLATNVHGAPMSITFRIAVLPQLPES